MAEFQRVPLRPRPDRNWLPRLGVALAAFLLVAIVKPWDLGGIGAAGEASAEPTFFVRPTERTGPRPYDPQLFSGREPDPAWELWPAGYVVQFGLAGPVKVHGPDDASPAPEGTDAAPPPASGVPPASDAPGSEPTTAPPTSGPTPQTPLGEGFVDLGPADHLIALGINTPLEFRVETVALSRLEDDSITPVAIVRLPTLWESTHFTVIAPEDPTAAGQAAVWEAGLYRLELTTAFGEVRIVDLRVRPAFAKTPEPSLDPTREQRPPFR